MSAQGFVEFGKDRSYGRRIEATDAVGRNDANVLRVILRDLDPGQKYHYRVGVHRGNGMDPYSAKTTYWTRDEGRRWRELTMAKRR